MPRNDAILFERRDGIAILTINRPAAMNALTDEEQGELHDCWTEFRDDPDLRVAVLTAAGERSFCAGANVKALSAADQQVQQQAAQQRRGPLRPSARTPFPRSLNLGKPVVAALNGYALGVGCALALQCDIRVATENAALGYPLIKLGMFPGLLHELLHAAPPSMALRSLMTGDPIPAKDCYRVGIYSEVVAHADLLPTALRIAGQINDNAPLVVQAIKEIWESQLDHTLDRMVHVFNGYSQLIARSEDAREGRRAFVEKRRAQWQGR